MSENQTIDRKTLLASLELCVNGNDCEGCVHAGESKCIMQLMRDALAALKEDAADGDERRGAK